MSQGVLIHKQPPVVKGTSFVDLLGNRRDGLTDQERRARWEQWKALDSEAAEWWQPEGCDGCVHLNNDWCKLQELPAAVNPILSYRYALPGTACMGAGKKLGPWERTDAVPDDDPF